MNQALIDNLISALVLAIVGVIAYGLRSLVTVGVLYLKEKLGTTKYAQLITFASTTVRALEQSPVSNMWLGDHKKQYAMEKLQAFADYINYPIEGEMIEDLVEEAVQIMNSEIQKIDLFEDLSLGSGLKE